MPGIFARLKARDGLRSRKKRAVGDAAAGSQPAKPKWDDAYTRRTVDPEEIHELLHCCTEELKARGLDLPFLLLPFRPTSDPSAVRTFVRHFFDHAFSLEGDALLQELRMTEPMVISGVAKWCWSRLQGGVVGWDAYELFKVGEYDSNKARDSFKTFIPISVENGAKQRIIFDFFDLIAAVAAHGKSNGFGGRQLSRMAAWWAFEQKDTGSGFDGGYKAWLSAADATSHLFFAYLRSLSPEQSPTGISLLPRSLEKLLKDTAYPPPRPQGMMTRTNKLVMMVDAVSPTPFALLRRAGHFQYRDSDRGLQEFSNYQDPIQALTEECCRVLKAISAANQSQASSAKHSTSLRDASWSRFEDMGFSTALAEEDEDSDENMSIPRQPGLRTTPLSGNDLARPTTPSWADFLSSGFVDDGPARPNVLLPPDKVLPPIETQIRQHSSQSHRPRMESDRSLEPGELASITVIELDDAFWWVWMSSLAPEETPDRKSAFGRCALIETKIPSARWIVMEEMIAGAAPEPQEGAYIAEKKRFFSWTKRGKTISRRKSTGKRALDRGEKNGANGLDGKLNVGADTHARIQAKAAQLRALKDQERQAAAQTSPRRGRTDADLIAEKTNSVLTLQPHIAGEASSAMKWVKKYDKGAIKDAYLANSNAGRGVAVSPIPSERTNGASAANGSAAATANGHAHSEPATPHAAAKDATPRPSVHSGQLPAEPESEPAQPIVEVVEQPSRPVPPPKVAEVIVAAAPLTAEHGETSHESAKLQKTRSQANKEKSGLRKLFTRKNRSSKVPDNAVVDLDKMLQQDEQAAEPPAEQMPTAAVTPSGAEEKGAEEPAAPLAPASPAPAASSDPVSETPKPVGLPESAHEPSAEDGFSQVDSRDAAEANREFSNFDQGPLTEQPAFAPDDDADDATPHPIARDAAPQDATSAPPVPTDGLSQSAGPGVQDRWAQIRKNAAQRAASRPKETSHGPPSRAGDADDDTSGEETIESRVARIKARVAELTGNMESSSAPQAVPNRR